VNSRLIGSLGMLAVIVLSAFPAPPSQATNINYGTNECQVAFYALATYAPQYTNNGVMNPGTSQNFHIVCSLPRSPLAPGATVAAFYVDGDNLNGAVTGCGVFSYDYTGTFLGAYAVDASEPHFDRYIAMPAAQVPYYSYTYLICTLPPGGNGVLRGVTSLQ
jgi:hypothetical protein